MSKSRLEDLTAEEVRGLSPETIDDVKDALIYIAAVEDLGPKQEAWAEFLGLPKSTLSGVLNGNRTLSLKAIEKVHIKTDNRYVGFLDRFERKLTEYRKKDVVNEYLCEGLDLIVGTETRVKIDRVPNTIALKDTLRVVFEEMAERGIVPKLGEPAPSSDLG